MTHLDTVQTLAIDFMEQPSLLHPLVGTTGYTVPMRDGLVHYDLNDIEQVARIKATHEITVTAEAGTENEILVHESLRAPKLTVRFNGTKGVCILGRNAVVEGVFQLTDESLVVIAGARRARVLALKIHFHSKKQRLFWGEGSSSEGTHTSVKGESVAIVVGDDCMFSWGVWLRPSDMHLVVDPISAKAINPPRDIVVEPHVWIGQEALILKGSHVGAGSILAARAVLPGRAYRRLSICAGNPAREVRDGVSWDRDSQSSAEAIRRVQEICLRYREESTNLDPRDVPNRRGQPKWYARLVRHLRAIRP